MRWLRPPPAATACFSSARRPGVVLRVSSTSTPVPRSSVHARAVAVAMPDRCCEEVERDPLAGQQRAGIALELERPSAGRLLEPLALRPRGRSARPAGRGGGRRPPRRRGRRPRRAPSARSGARAARARRRRPPRWSGRAAPTSSARAREIRSSTSGVEHAAVPYRRPTLSAVSRGDGRQSALPRGVRAAVPRVRERGRAARGRGLPVEGDRLVFNRSLAQEGRLGFWRWLSMLLGIAGTYRKHETVDVQYDGERQAARRGEPEPEPRRPVG